jgi:hypothetical protein
MRRRVKIGKAFDLTASVADEPPAGDGQRKVKPLPKRVAVGQEFDAKITSSKDWVDVSEAVTRSRMAWAVFGVIAVFLFGAAGLGFYKGEFSALQGIWSVAGPIYGGIAGYFFHRQHKR